MYNSWVCNVHEVTTQVTRPVYLPIPPHTTGTIMSHFSTTVYLENDNDKINTKMFLASMLFSGKLKKKNDRTMATILAL